MFSDEGCLLQLFVFNKINRKLIILEIKISHKTLLNYFIKKSLRFLYISQTNETLFIFIILQIINYNIQNY